MVKLEKGFDIMIQKEDIEYTIEIAKPEMINEYISKLKKIAEPKQFSGLAAIDTNNKIIGRVIYEIKDRPTPLEGVDWYIHNLCVLPELRRNGVASTLLNNLTKLAEETNVESFFGGCTNTPAHMFWDKHKFCFLTYTSTPEEDGNFPHLFFRRVKCVKSKNEVLENEIIPVAQEEFSVLFEKHIMAEENEWFRNKKDDFICFALPNEKAEQENYIFAYEDDMGTPLNGKQLVISRTTSNFSVVSKSLKSIIAFAEEKGYSQISRWFFDFAEVEFWHKNDFSICVHYNFSLSENGSYPISASLRL
jgi:GNAT superfamily N-acetyltransferase